MENNLTKRQLYMKEYRKRNADHIRAYRRSREDKNREYGDRYRRDNAEYFERYFKEYYAKNKEKKKLESKKYRESHREHYTAYLKKYYQDNKDRHRERGREWSKNNRDRIKTYRIGKEEIYRRSSRKYRLKHPEAAKRATAIRRARILRVGGNIDMKYIAALKVRQKGKCYWCSVKLNGKHHLDHVIPLSRGGDNSNSNVVLSCPPCNLKKGVKTPMEFAGLLL